jgi:hypothetical protein
MAPGLALAAGGRMPGVGAGGALASPVQVSEAPACTALPVTGINRLSIRGFRYI